MPSSPANKQTKAAVPLIQCSGQQSETGSIASHVCMCACVHVCMYGGMAQLKVTVEYVQQRQSNGHGGRGALGDDRDDFRWRQPQK